MVDIIFERKASTSGNSIVISLPPELMAYLDIKQGDDLCLIGQEKKKGKFLAIWKKEDR